MERNVRAIRLFGSFATGLGLVQIVLTILTIWALAGFDYELSWPKFGLGYIVVIGAIVAFLSVMVGAAKVFENFGTWWENGLAKLSALVMPDKWERLLCSTTPAQGLRPVGYTPRLLYQRVIGAYCKPTAT